MECAEGCERSAIHSREARGGCGGCAASTSLSAIGSERSAIHSREARGGSGGCAASTPQLHHDACGVGFLAELEGRPSTRLLPLALTAALWLLLIGATAAAAAAAASSVTLNLQGGYANRQLTACSLKHHYTFFHAGHTITMKGSVAPTPASHWRVKVKVKQCLRGGFRTVWTGYAGGHADGSFKTTYRASRRGFLFARAYYYGATPTVRSDKQYFHAP